MNERGSGRGEAETRRRWVTLAELVAVAGVVIAALTLYNGWADRREDAATRVEERAGAARDRARFELRGTVAPGGRSVTLMRDEDHPLGDVAVAFPAALGVPRQDAVGHAIEADWFDAALKRQTDGGADDRTGRLPVLVTYTYLTDDVPTTRRAVYDIVWRTEGQFMRGRRVELTDFRLRERGGDQRRIDAMWARDKPAG